MGQWFSGVDRRGYENHSWTFVSAGSWFSCYKHRVLSSPFILAVFFFQPIFVLRMLCLIGCSGPVPLRELR